MSQRLYDCPQCGAPVKFQSSVAVFAVCEHCRSMVVDRRANVETMGVMADLPPDLTPFKIGTRGEWNGNAFELIGRVRVLWADGSWNEWCALFGDGRIGWLGEAQGQWMISFAAPRDESLPANPQDCYAGLRLELAGHQWTVIDRKETRCLAGEGELPFIATPDRARVSIDMTDARGAFGSLEFYDDGPQLFVGQYATFGELRFSELRPVPGWNAGLEQEKNKTSALSCPNCGAPVNLRAAGLTMSATCGSCGSLIDTSNPHLQLIEEAHAATQQIPVVLPIGQRGLLRGIEWEVIGVCRRADQWAKWMEYLLFNPWHGFVWLVTYNGHWSYVERLTGLGNLQGAGISYDGRDYHLYGRGAARVESVLGEFYWKVARGESALLSDFIAPPHILSKEFYNELNEFTWSHGTYLPHTEVATAFGFKQLPEPVGIYLNQPNPFAERWNRVKAPWFLAIAAALLIQLVFIASSTERKIYEHEFVFDRATTSQPAAGAGNIPLEAATPPAAPPNVLTTPHFTLDGGTSRVEIEGDADVNNNWLGADLELVNVETNERYAGDLEIGYYHGPDWSEGGTTERATIPAVPAGVYFLEVEPSADQTITRMPFQLKVMRGGIYWSNFLFALVAISLYPAYLLFRRSGFERMRWSESDYSPYATEE